MDLTKAEVRLILAALAQVNGPGYSSDPVVMAIQAKMSIQLEVLNQRVISHG